eukprot:COSAG04_NODE_2_length_56781_cov_25.092252_30_plen_50_part_00
MRRAAIVLLAAVVHTADAQCYVYCTLMDCCVGDYCQDISFAFDEWCACA